MTLMSSSGFSSFSITLISVEKSIADLLDLNCGFNVNVFIAVGIMLDRLLPLKLCLENVLELEFLVAESLLRSYE